MSSVPAGPLRPLVLTVALATTALVLRSPGFAHDPIPALATPTPAATEPPHDHDHDPAHPHEHHHAEAGHDQAPEESEPGLAHEPEEAGHDPDSPSAGDQAGHDQDHDHDHDHDPAEPDAGVIEVPARVRDNLGISFARVERRRVAATMRLPGRFEARPEARAEYRATGRGTVALVARQYQRVEPGDVLYRIDSAAWREVQARLSEAELAAELLEARQAAAARAVASATRAVELQATRHANLAALHEQGTIQLPDVAAAASDLAEAEEWLGAALARQHELGAEALALRDPADGNRRFAIALREAATLVGREESWLLAAGEGGGPRWRTLRAIEVTARRAGVVQRVVPTDGGLVEAGDLVVETLDPAAVRFRGFALQADLGRLADGARVAIVPPHGGIASYSESIAATLTLGTEADPEERTFDLVAVPVAGGLPAWARPGVAAFVEVVVAGDGETEELAIPNGAVVADGLERVFFRRDVHDPDRVHRVAGHFGADDGRWIVVRGGGLREGDEVVLEGAYELKLAGGGGSAEQRGGHFHADGTFHGEDH